MMSPGNNEKKRDARSGADVRKYMKDMPDDVVLSDTLKYQSMGYLFV
jgi:hypothetical protein